MSHEAGAVLRAIDHLVRHGRGDDMLAERQTRPALRCELTTSHAYASGASHAA